MNDTLEYKGYYGNVHFSAEDDAFIGEVIGINDIIIFQGATVEELKNSFLQAIEDYLDACKEVGKDPDKAYKGSFNVRISSELHRKAAIVAAINNVTLNDLVKTAIDNLVKNSSRKLVH